MGFGWGSGIFIIGEFETLSALGFDGSEKAGVGIVGKGVVTTSEDIVLVFSNVKKLPIGYDADGDIEVALERDDLDGLFFGSIGKTPFTHLTIVKACLLYTSPSPRDRG